MPPAGMPPEKFHGALPAGGVLDVSVTKPCPPYKNNGVRDTVVFIISMSASQASSRPHHGQP